MNEIVKLNLFVITILGTVNFFNPFGLLFNAQGKKIIFYLCFICLSYISIKHGRKIKNNQYPCVFYYGLLFSFIFSCFVAYYYHDQSFSESVITTLPYIVGYGFFVVFLRLDISKPRILSVIWWLLGISIVVFFVNFAFFPDVIFGTSKEEYDYSRGIVRLWVPFSELFVLGLFYAINRWQLYGQKKYLYAIIVCSIMIFLTVTRQTIVLSGVLGGWMIMKNSSYRKKFAFISSFAILSLIVLPRLSVFQTMVELSEQQSELREENEGDIREKAWMFYTIENQTNEFTPIVGNGVPAFAKSNWGKEIDAITTFNKCIVTDVGWAGFYFYFGFVGTMCLLVLLIKAFLLPKNEDERYLSYWIIFVILTSVASGVILYYNQIFSVSLVLYLIYGGREKLYSANHFKLQ